MGRTDLRRRVSVAAVEKIRCVKGTLASPGDPIRLAVCQFYRIFGTRRADRSQQRAAVTLRNLRLIVLSITALGIVFTDRCVIYFPCTTVIFYSKLRMSRNYNGLLFTVIVSWSAGS